MGKPIGKVPNVKKPTCSDPIPRCVSDVEGHIRVGTGKKWVTRIDSRILAEVPQGTTLNPRVPGNTTSASKRNGKCTTSAQKGDEKFSASHIVPKTSRPADKPKALICIAASMNSSS